MNTPTITLPKDEAKEKLAAIRKVLQSKAVAKMNAEVKQQYLSLKAGYNALAKGSTLIDIQDAFRACGYDDKGRPKLALARADRRIINMCWQSNGPRFRPEGTKQWNPRDTRVITGIEAPPESFYKRGEYTVQYEGYAQVPMIPADVRPHTGEEKDWFILWEVEKWEDKRNKIIPDKDPYLLKHLGGQLYVVLAEWDLTELERAVMKINI